MKKLRIGVIGTGFIGGRHIDSICRIPGAQIVAMADTAIEAVRDIAEKYGANPYTSVDEMLEREELDVIHNCTPTSMHYHINARVIKAGIHLYCEKPLSLNSGEGNKLLALLAEHPVANAVNFNYRMNAMIQDMHHRVKKDEMGRSFLVTGHYIQDWMMKKDDYDWRLNPEIGGASRAIADIGSHLFDTSQYVLGKKITAVNAHLMILHPTRQQYEKAGGTFSKKKGTRVKETAVVNEDAAGIMVRFEDGSSGLFSVSQVSAGHKNDMSLRFDFESCSCEWRQEENNLLYIGHRDEPNQVKYREATTLSEEAKVFTELPAGHSEGWNDVLYQAISAFYRSIQTGNYSKSGALYEVPYATIQDGVWIMRIIESCLISHAYGQWIDVETGEKI